MIKLKDRDSQPIWVSFYGDLIYVQFWGVFGCDAYSVRSDKLIIKAIS